MDFDTNYFLKDLNEAQQEAVLSFGRPQLVLSGAGSGKTRVLTYKIIFLLKIKNIPPENILALTFTNKAANEMKDRITNLIGGKFTKRLIMGTFHSIFCKILRKNIIYLEGKKFNANFKIIAEHESKDIIKSVIEEYFHDEFEDYLEKKGINDNIKRKKELTQLIKKAKEKISLLKNRGITYEKYFDLQNEIDKDESDNFAFFKNIYKTYVQICQNENVMDFDDLLLNTLLLFGNKNNIKILERYQNYFQYILVDEYQDTNIVQYEIIKALAWKSKNIFVVGDDYQNIYSFRGASRLNIDKFKQNFPDFKETKLCQNYRSNSIIVKASNKLILNNKKQIIKELFSRIKETEGKIKLSTYQDGKDEANKIAYIIQELVESNKCNYKDISILYRINRQHENFKTSFFQKGIPHKIYNGKSIFESRIIKIIYYYLRYIADQSSDFVLFKIINFPRRNIGKATINKLLSTSKYNNISCWEIINNCDNEEKIKKYKISKDIKNKLLPFKKLILDLKAFSEINTLYILVEELLKYLKIDEYDKTPSTKEQLDMLKEKIKEMEEEHIKDSKDKFTLREFLEDFSLLIDNEENDEDENKKDRVKLMTIHQAKGLEFKYVFIVGLEEGYYPCGNFVNDEDELEEERRIFYVAITRAKINCYLSYAHERLNYNNEVKIRIQSPFIDEIYDPEYIQIYDLKNDINYINYENKFSKDFNNSITKKNNNFRKYRKFKFSDNSDDEENNFNNNNENNGVQNNFYGENNFVKCSYLLAKYKKVHDFNLNNISKLDDENKIDYSLKENIETKNIPKKLNKETNDEYNKKEKKKRDKSKTKNKINSKNNLKFKTIDSFFNPK